MMSKIGHITLLLISLNTIAAQKSRLAISLVDDTTQELIKDARIELLQYPGAEFTLDRRTGWFFMDNVNVGKIVINVWAEGYEQYSNPYYTVSESPENNNFRLSLKRKSFKPQLHMYGEITDEKGSEIAGGIVELMIRGEIYLDTTNSSGNYNFWIDKTRIENAETYRIEVEGTGCPEKHREIGDLPNSVYLEKNITINCSGNTRGSIEYIIIPGGKFEMGDRFGKTNNNSRQDERPVHSVSVKSFYCSPYEITNEEYCAFLNAVSPDLTITDAGLVKRNGMVVFDLSCTKCSAKLERIRYYDFSYQVNPGYELHPVVLVSWYGAIQYCNWKSFSEGLMPVYQLEGSRVYYLESNNGYRLPTEAEWEYIASDAGKRKYFGWGNSLVAPVANLAGQERNFNQDPKNNSLWKGYRDSYLQTCPVNEFQQGDLGLYNISGNVWEWCWDWYDASYYKKSSTFDNPTGPDSGKYKVVRGGSWSSPPSWQRISKRKSFSPETCTNNLGFRIVRSEN